MYRTSLVDRWYIYMNIFSHSGALLLSFYSYEPWHFDEPACESKLGPWWSLPGHNLPPDRPFNCCPPATRLLSTGWSGALSTASPATNCVIRNGHQILYSPTPIIIKSFSDDVSWPDRDSSNSLIFLLINIMAKLCIWKKNILLVEIFLTFLIFVTIYSLITHKNNHSFWHNIASIYSYMGLEDEAFSALLLIEDQIHFWNPFVRISIRLFIYNDLRYCFIAFSWHLQGVRLQYWYLIIWIVFVLMLLCKCRVDVARGRSSTTFPTNINNWLFIMIMIFYPFYSLSS